MKVVRSSASRIGRLYPPPSPRICSWYSFLLGAVSIPRLCYGRRVYVKKKFQRRHRNPTRDLSACSLNQMCLRVPPNMVRDLQYSFFCPSVALRNVTKICQVTNQSSLGNKSVERTTQVLRLSLNTTVES